jgi:tetratricopeptide (TPR) repeat protein
MDCYDLVLDIDPRYVKALNNKGNALDSLGRYQEAIECYDTALGIDPRDAQALFNKGVALDSLGRYQEALDYFSIFIELAPPQYAANVKKVEERIRQLKQKMNSSNSWVRFGPDGVEQIVSGDE